jgi:hypothetical protein
LDLLHWVLTHNYLMLNGDMYLQTSGTAMGTPCAPAYANLVLFHMEIDLVSHYQPVLYQRYLDDLFVIFSSADQATTFGTAFNRRVPEIQLVDINIDTSGVFLDMYVFIQQGSILTRLYQKPTNKYLYITPKSSHHTTIITNFVRQELKRYYLYSSLAMDFEHLKAQFYDRLIQRGYTADFLRPIFNQSMEPRTRLLQELILTTQSKQKKNQHYYTAQQPKHPVAIVNLPSKLHQGKQFFELTRLFSIPEAVRTHPYYAKAFPHSTRPIPVIARKLGKNLFRLIDADKFTYIPPRIRRPHPPEESDTEENPPES